jgi:TetR/AcrR family fatty acid metabolism transcriptional regulator
MTTTPVALDPDLSPKEVHLIRSAYQVIGEKGVHGVSLQDVADVAGVSKGVTLYYFKTKENLILATMRWALSRVAERIRAAVANEVSPEGRVLATVNAIFIDPEANRRFYVAYLDLVDFAARSDSFKEVTDTFDSTINGLYAEVVGSGVREGAFDVFEVEEGAKVLRAIIDGLFVQWLTSHDRDGTYHHYRDMCGRAALAYLTSL